TDITAELKTGGGQVGGYLTARDSDVPNVVASLDQIAFGITTQVNAQSQLGIDLNGTPGISLFTQTATVAGSAASMSVAITDPSLIAAAAAGQGSGDNTNAATIANLGSISNPAFLNAE